MGIAELIARVGDEHIMLEPVHDCVQGATLRKGGLTELRLLTSQTNPTAVACDEWPKIGLLIWLPRELVDKARADHANGTFDAHLRQLTDEIDFAVAFGFTCAVNRAGPTNEPIETSEDAIAAYRRRRQQETQS